jgi:hypothetical protein
MEGDKEFQDHQIASVEQQSDGTYAIGFDGGLILWCGKDCPVVPEVGQPVRLYGKGLGARVRGLIINGATVWYRTEAEDKEHSEIEMYGADAADWLDRWDAGKGVWSIEMGGLGPGYEQCIHITAAELLRWIIQQKPGKDQFGDEWRAFREAMETAAFANTTIEKLGLSGAQFGAAVNLACQLYQRGPRAIMKDERVKDRHIQVSKNFPAAA